MAGVGTVRRQLEEREDRILAPYAAHAARSRGRAFPERPSDVRTDFQRDRDRIIHSKAFRRLKDKTQVFFTPQGDHYRTRLTHTLEVMQIARTIARALRLNEDLVEAISLGHDLGHTPFGHSGEYALDAVVPGGFRHFEQSVRAVEFLEQREAAGLASYGLNLTYEVRDGIWNHTGRREPTTLEARVAKLSDRIAYVSHDIDDAVRAGLLRASDLPRDCIATLGRTSTERINTMVTDVIRHSRDQPVVRLSDGVWQALDGLRDFLFDRVYLRSAAKDEEAKAQNLLRRLYLHFVEHPEQMPPDLLELGRRLAEEAAAGAHPPAQGTGPGPRPAETADAAEVAGPPPGSTAAFDSSSTGARKSRSTPGFFSAGIGFDIPRLACDYVAGMTDRYAIAVFEQIYVPGPWRRPTKAIPD